MDIPVKYYWCGVDIETMNKEQLINVVKGLVQELNNSRATAKTVIDMQRRLTKAS